MKYASKVAIGIRWALAAMALAGCGGTSPARDAGPRDDSGSTPGTDGGMPRGDAGTEPTIDTATWSVSGASSASESHDGDANYVSCQVVPSSPDFLSMTSGQSAGSDPSIVVRVMRYDGPGTYTLAYVTGSSADAQVDVRLLADYSYQYFYDYSTVDFREIYSTCVVTVDETTPGARIHVAVSCSDLVSDILSTDYDDRNAAGYRPHVSLTATFDCDI